MPSKKRINAILEILRLSDKPYNFLGSYNNPDFEYWGDVDVDLPIEFTEDLPYKIKSLLERIKRFGPELGFGFVEFKFGIDKRNYFRSNNLIDYEKRWKMKFSNLDEARQYTKMKYTNRIYDVNASISEIKKKFKKPKFLKLDVVVRDKPNFMIEIVYNFKDKPLDLISEILDDVDKNKAKGKWDKVIKRLYSIAKITENEKRKKELADIIRPYLRDIWLAKSIVEIPQDKDWVEYVKSQNIDLPKLQETLRQLLLEFQII